VLGKVRGIFDIVELNPYSRILSVVELDSIRSSRRTPGPRSQGAEIEKSPWCPASRYLISAPAFAGMEREYFAFGRSLKALVRYTAYPYNHQAGSQAT
jgi:hypothetical protein